MTTDPRPSPQPGPAASAGPLLEQRFDAGSLYALRAAVAAHADAAGLSRQRVYDVTAAVHEMAANAVLHGAGHGLARLWTQDGFLHCQVSDHGPARPDNPGPPPRAVPWPAEHGHGLWIVARVADSSSTDHGPTGTTVTARFALSPARHLARRTPPARRRAQSGPAARHPASTPWVAGNQWPGTHTASPVPSRVPAASRPAAYLRLEPGRKAGRLQIPSAVKACITGGECLFESCAVPCIRGTAGPVDVGAGRPLRVQDRRIGQGLPANPGSPEKACQVP